MMQYYVIVCAGHELNFRYYLKGDTLAHAVEAAMKDKRSWFQANFQDLTPRQILKAIRDNELGGAEEVVVFVSDAEISETKK